MKKKILAVLLTGMMCASLVACGGSNADSGKKDSTKTEASDDSKSESSDGSLDINVILKTTASEYWGYVQAGCMKYSKDNPDINVEVQGASSETA